MGRFIYRNLFWVALIGFIFLTIYFVVRYSFFIIPEQRFVDKFFALILLIGETHILIHAAGYILGIIRIGSHSLVFPKKKIDPKNAPSVAIMVTEKNEPEVVLSRTLTAVKTISYPNEKKNIYILSSSVSPESQKMIDHLAQFFGAKVFRQNEPRGAKAGIINDFIKQLKEKYLVVFDADQTPMPDFLEETVPIIEASSNIAFVQTPQFYSNVETSPIAEGAAMQQAIFFENICEAKGIANAMFCCGTNFIMRRDVLLEVGGFEEKSITEDFATSIKIHLKKYRSVYYNRVLAFGMAPENLPIFFKQQNRWAVGTISVFKKIIGYFFKNPFALKTIQWWEYFLSGTYYFIGWAFFFLMVGPIVFLLIDIPTYFINPMVYLFIYTPYFLFAFAIFYATMEKRHYTLKNLYYGIILGTLSFPVFMKSAVYALLGKKVRWAKTVKGRKGMLSFPELWPWTLMIAINGLAIYIGIIKFYLALRFDTIYLAYAYLINIFWCSYHLYILRFIYYFNENPHFGKSVIPNYKEVE